MWRNADCVTNEPKASVQRLGRRDLGRGEHGTEQQGNNILRRNVSAEGTLGDTRPENYLDSGCHAIAGRWQASRPGTRCRNEGVADFLFGVDEVCIKARPGQ